MLIGTDTETAKIEPGLLAPPLTCVSLAWRDADEIRSELCDHIEGVERMHAYLLDPSVEFTGVNTVYDFGVLAAEEPELIPLIFKAFDDGRCHDPSNRQKLIDNARGILNGYFPGGGARKVEYKYSVLGLVQRHLGRDRSAEKEAPDAWRLRYGELRGVPLDEWPEEARTYAITDAVDHLLIHEAQLPDEGLIRDAANQQRAHLALHLASCWGVKTSPEAIRRLEEGARATYDALTDKLVAAGLVRAPRKVRPSRKNPQGRMTDPSRDTKVAKARMVAVMAALGEPVKLTDKGQELAEDHALTPVEVEEYAALNEEACRESLDDVLIDYAERTSLQTVVESHIPALWKGVDTPIQAHFNLIVETGRISCRFREDGKDKNPPPLNGYQLTNVRRLEGIRECFVARPGKVFISVDLPMAELHGVAQVMIKQFGWSKLAETLNAGRDVHLQLAASDMGITYEDIVARRKEESVALLRQFMKVPNYALPGGMGPKGLRLAYSNADPPMKITLDKAKETIDSWLNAFPEFREYRAWISSICENGGATIEQLFSGRLRGRVTYTSAANGFFQGLISDAAKAALYVVSRACYVEEESPLYGARVWNFPHDEVIIECDEEIAHEAGQEQARIMRDEANKWLPDVPFRELEPTIMRCWSKGADAVWLDGRMIPWTLEIGHYRKLRTKVSVARREGRNADAQALVVEQSAAWEALDEVSRDAMIEEGGK